MLCLQAQLTVWPTAPTPTPPLLICSANYLGGLAWPTPPPLQRLAETALLPRPLGWARSPRLLSDTFQFIIKVFTSKISQGGRVPTRRALPVLQGPPALSLWPHWPPLPPSNCPAVYLAKAPSPGRHPKPCQLFKAKAPGGSPWLSPQHHSAQPLPRPTHLGQPLPLRVRSTA